LFAGLTYVPVVPVGIIAVLDKRKRDFGIDVTVNVNDGYFMSLAVDSSNYKRVRDSLVAKRVETAAYLPATGCYMIVNGSKKVPLRVKEYFMQQTHSHNYRMYASVGFGKVRTITIVTGNPLLDSCLKNLVFKRKKRITHAVYWLS
jgi:hypothetical protein